MITDKIKALFNFIEFLHSNIDNFNKYNKLINELELLVIEKQKLSPENNYKDKLKYNTIQTELESKFKTLQDNTANLIKAEAKKLNLCNFDKEPEYSFNGIETEIQQLKENFNNLDLLEIFKHKDYYIEYRTVTHKTYLSMAFFFNDLDEITKSLFDFFKDNTLNEFETFETKTIIVNNESKLIELITKGYNDYKLELNKSYSLPDLRNSIFDLTLQNLVDCGLNKKHTLELLNTKGKYSLQCNEGNFFVSGKEKKVYTGIEFYRKTYFDNDKILFPFSCPDLIPEYFDLALNEFKQEQKKFLGKIYNESDTFFGFIKSEVNKTQNHIETQKEYLLKHKHHKFTSKENVIKVCEAYIQFLKRKKEEVKQPQQTETIKPDEVKKDFKDFFNPDIEIKTINSIQTNFKDSIGKKMAFLIYLLDTEFKIINYSLNGKNDSRKHFVKSLKNIETKMQGINKYFEANSTNLNIHKFEDDNDYKKIKDFLTKTIN